MSGGGASGDSAKSIVCTVTDSFRASSRARSILSGDICLKSSDSGFAMLYAPKSHKRPA